MAKTPLHEVYIRVEINGAGASNCVIPAGRANGHVGASSVVDGGADVNAVDNRHAARRPGDGAGDEPGGRAGGARAADATLKGPRR